MNSLDEFILAWMDPNRQKDSLFFRENPNLYGVNDFGL